MHEVWPIRKHVLVGGQDPPWEEAIMGSYLVMLRLPTANILNLIRYRAVAKWSLYQLVIIRVRSKLKVQNSSTFQGTKLHFSSTKIIDKKPYPRCGHSKFRLQSDTDVQILLVSKYWSHAYKRLLQNCQQMQNFKICKI